MQRGKFQKSKLYFFKKKFNRLYIANLMIETEMFLVIPSNWVIRKTSQLWLWILRARILTFEVIHEWMKIFVTYFRENPKIFPLYVFRVIRDGCFNSVFPKLFEPRLTKLKSKISRHTNQFTLIFLPTNIALLHSDEQIL
jgi:hypothetical protein